MSEDADRLARTARNVIYVQSAFALYCLITLARPDAQLVQTNQSLTIPFLEMDVNLFAFVVGAPAILIAVAVYGIIFFAQLQKHTESPPRVFIFTFDSWPARTVSALLFFWLAPITLWVFAWRLLPRPEATFVILLAAGITVASLVLHPLLLRRSGRLLRVLVAIGIAVTVITCALFLVGRGWMTTLRRVDLFGASLVGADLRDVRLNGAVLQRADLTGAALIYAHLQGANMSLANVERADLGGARLTGAIMTKLRGKEAQFRKADLNRAWLYKADLVRADFTGADLSGACLARADLRGSDLRDTVLAGTVISGADLRGSQELSCSHLTRAEGWQHTLRDQGCGAPIPETAPTTPPVGDVWCR